eukprot:Hpha_TRINITY_DN15930_c2_g7::TRINITY_DN15930_c2_g7_i2::g.74760::m.74760
MSALAAAHAEAPIERLGSAARRTAAAATARLGTGLRVVNLLRLPLTVPPPPVRVRRVLLTELDLLGRRPWVTGLRRLVLHLVERVKTEGQVQHPSNRVEDDDRLVPPLLNNQVVRAQPLETAVLRVRQVPTVHPQCGQVQDTRQHHQQDDDQLRVATVATPLDAEPNSVQSDRTGRQTEKEVLLLPRSDADGLLSVNDEHSHGLREELVVPRAQNVVEQRDGVITNPLLLPHTRGLRRRASQQRDAQDESEHLEEVLRGQLVPETTRELVERVLVTRHHVLHPLPGALVENLLTRHGTRHRKVAQPDTKDHGERPGQEVKDHRRPVVLERADVPVRVDVRDLVPADRQLSRLRVLVHVVPECREQQQRREHVRDAQTPVLVA